MNQKYKQMKSKYKFLVTLLGCSFRKTMTKAAIPGFLFTFALFQTSCDDERSLAQDPSSFEVKLSDYVEQIKDTIVVNVNEKITFNFTNGCTDQILFYSGELGAEYRFSQRNFYEAATGINYETKITVNTELKNFDAALSKEYSLIALTNLQTNNADGLSKATKTEIMKLRSNAAIQTALSESYTVNATSAPVALSLGDLNLAIVSKSADATKNMLSIPAAGVEVTGTETRDYGYKMGALTVSNIKTKTNELITKVISTAAWAQHIPTKTIAPGSSLEVDNAIGYGWNLGELGVSYAPAVNGATMAPNANGVAIAVSYPVSVTAPVDPAKVVSAGQSPSEAWLISRPFNFNAIKSDIATSIKRAESSTLKYYQYIYKERGVYKASIVGINVGTSGTKKVVHEFIILVKNSSDQL